MWNSQQHFSSTSFAPTLLCKLFDGNFFCEYVSSHFLYDPVQVFTLIWLPPWAQFGVLENTAKMAVIIFYLLGYMELG